MTKELTQFKYEQLDESTADFLRQKESNMRQIVGKAYTELGKELYEAQQELAGNNHYDGVFERWYTYLGWKKRTVYNLIDRYLLVQKLHDKEKETLEDLPVTLTYEIAKPSAESTSEKAQAKSEVLAGDISSLKEYRERIKELEKKAEAEKAERERLEQVNEELTKEADKPPEVVTEYKTEYVEVRDEEAERRLREYERRFGDISNYDESITATNRQDMIVSLGSFTRGVRDFAKRYAYLIQYKEVIANLDDSHKQSYNESVISLKELAELFETVDSDIIIINQ